MDENKNGQEEITLNIPGVIIPPQQTENGQVIKSAIVQNEQPTVETNKEVVPQPTQEVSNVVNTVSQPQEPTVENINNNNNNNNPQNVQMQSTPVETIELDKNGNKKPPKKKSSGALILIIILLIGVIIYLGYYIMNNKKEDVDPVKELQRQRSVDKNSLIAKTLFSYVDLKGCYPEIEVFYSDKDNITLNDLSDEAKNYLAYNVIKYKDVEEKNCSTYSKALHANDSVNLWYCGDYNKKETTTYVFSDEVLKNQVINMFGEGTYKSKSFLLKSSARYLFDDKTSTYIYQNFDGENACTPYTNSLVKVSRQNDMFTLKVKVTNNQTNKIKLFYYTFQETENGNYNFVSLVKKDA